GLALRFCEHLLALLDDPTRLLDLLGNRGAHLVENLPDLLPIDAHLVRERKRLGVVHQLIKLVYENENVHQGLLATTSTVRREAPAECASDDGRHELLESATKCRNLLHTARGHET